MAKRNQEDIWNPFAERVDGLSPKQRLEVERAQALELYLNGGGGEPTYFDYPTVLKNRERQR